MRTMRAVGSHPVVRYVERTGLVVPRRGGQSFRTFSPEPTESLKFAGRTNRRNGNAELLFGKYLPDARILPNRRLTSFET